MSGSTLAAKMKRKPGARAALIQAPAGYEAASFPGMKRAAASLTGVFDWIQIFVKDRAQLERLAPKAAKALAGEATLWISFPKGSSGIQTDLSRDRGWDIIKDLDLKWITLISINADWSAFSLRRYKPGEKRQAPR